MDTSSVRMTVLTYGRTTDSDAAIHSVDKLADRIGTLFYLIMLNQKTLTGGSEKINARLR